MHSDPYNVRLRSQNSDYHMHGLNIFPTPTPPPQANNSKYTSMNKYGFYLTIDLCDQPTE